jgi:hypothetical protein
VTVQVASVHLPDRDDLVIVQFKDGHRALFVENQGGLGEANALECIWLERGGNTVAVYNSPYQRPVNRRPFGLVRLADGYTRPQVVAYWKAACDHIVAEQHKGRLLGAWRVIIKGAKDIEELGLTRP